MAKITSVKTSVDNNKLFTAQINDDNTREFKEFDISSGINNKTLQETADVTSFDEGMDVITVNNSGDKFIGVDRRGREVVNLETNNNFSVNAFNLLSSFKVDRLVRGDVYEISSPGLDVDFVNVSFNSHIQEIIKSENHIYVGGFFTSPKQYLLRLNGNGEFDDTYTPPSQIDNVVWSLYYYDDKIYVGIGPNSSLPGKVIRLNSDGSYDDNFNVINTPKRPLTIKINGEGELLIGGGFISGYILKYTSDGIPLSFSPPSFNLEVDDFDILPNNDIICSGRYTSPTNGLCKLNNNGNMVSGFNTINTNNWNGRVKYNPYDGMIYNSGRFTSPKNRILRMDINGNIDNSFSPPPSTNNYGVDFQFFEDKIIFTGFFTIPKRSIMMLNHDGSLVNDFTILVNNSAYHTLIDGNNLFVSGIFTSPKNYFLRYKLKGINNFVIQTEIPFITLSSYANRLIKVTTSIATPASDFTSIAISDGVNTISITPAQVNTEINANNLQGRQLTVTYNLTGNKDINTILNEYSIGINK